jgi:hypothetical protein
MDPLYVILIGIILIGLVFFAISFAKLFYGGFMQLISEIELFEILKAKIGEKEAKTLVEYIEAKVEKRFIEKKDLFVTKEDLANAKAELEIKMEKIRSDIIKWMFIFWVGQIGALIAILQIFFGK